MKPTITQNHIAFYIFGCQLKNLLHIDSNYRLSIIPPIAIIFNRWFIFCNAIAHKIILQNLLCLLYLHYFRITETEKSG